MKEEYCIKNGEVSPEKISKEAETFHMFSREIVCISVQDSVWDSVWVSVENSVRDSDWKAINKDLCGI